MAIHITPQWPLKPLLKMYSMNETGLDTKQCAIVHQMPLKQFVLS